MRNLKAMSACFIAFCLFPACLLPQSVHAEDTGIRILKLKNANCEEMVTLIQNLSHGSIHVASDKRTNSVIMLAEPDQVTAIQEMLQQLDEKVEQKPKPPADVRAKAHQGKRSPSHEEEAKIRAIQGDLELLDVRKAISELQTKHEVALASATIDSLKRLKKMAERRHSHVHELHKNGKVSLAEVDQAETEKTKLDMELQKQTLKLELLRATLPLRLREIEIAIASRKRELRQLQKD